MPQVTSALPAYGTLAHALLCHPPRSAGTYRLPLRLTPEATRLQHAREEFLQVAHVAQQLRLGVVPPDTEPTWQQVNLIQHYLLSLGYRMFVGMAWDDVHRVCPTALPYCVYVPKDDYHLAVYFARLGSASSQQPD